MPKVSKRPHRSQTESSENHAPKNFLMMMRPRKVSFEDWCTSPSWSDLAASSSSSLKSATALHQTNANNPVPVSPSSYTERKLSIKSLCRPSPSVCLSSLAPVCLLGDCSNDGSSSSDDNTCEIKKSLTSTLQDEAPDGAVREESPSSWGQFVDVVPLEESDGRSRGTVASKMSNRKNRRCLQRTFLPYPIHQRRFKDEKRKQHPPRTSGAVNFHHDSEKNTSISLCLVSSKGNAEKATVEEAVETKNSISEDVTSALCNMSV